MYDIYSKLTLYQTPEHVINLFNPNVLLLHPPENVRKLHFFRGYRNETMG